MAEKKFKIPKRDAERALRVLEFERKAESKARRPGAGSCLLFLFALAIAGAVVFYVFAHRAELSRLWQRPTQPDTIPAETGPDIGY
jgi:hypothetical protein